MANNNPHNPANDIAAELTRNRHPLYGGPRERKEVVALPLDMVIPDERQPRQTAMDEAALGELVQSVKEQGLLQPITVRPNRRDESGQTFLIVAGHRRYEAHKRAGLERIEAIIRRDLDDRKAAELQLLENLQRENLSPLDEAAAYQRFIDEFGYTQEELADRVGRNRTSVSKTLKINQLPETIRSEYIKLPPEKRVGKSALIEIASASDEKAQLVLWRRAKSGADVRAVRAERQEKPSNELAPLKTGAQKRRIVETYTYGREFTVEFLKRLRKLTPKMLQTNPQEAEPFRKLYDELQRVVTHLRQKLEEAQVDQDGDGERVPEGETTELRSEPAKAEEQAAE